MKIIKRKLMCKMVVFALVLICTGAAALVKSPPEKAILPNGLRVIVLEDKSLPVVAAGLVFNAKPYFMNNCNSGIGRIYRSLMASADFENESRFDFNSRIEQTGILNEFGGGQEVFYSACNGSNDNLDIIFEALFKIGFKLKPDADAFGKAKTETLRFVRTARKYPRSYGLLEKMIWKDLYPEMSFEAQSPINEKELAKLQPACLEKFIEATFVPNNAVLVVVGDVSASEVFKTAMKRFGNLQAAELSCGNTTKESAKATSRKSENIEFLDLDETEVALGFEAPGYGQPDMAAAYLWQAALHEINNSWLEFVVRKDFPELKNLYARYIPGKEKGIFVIGFSTKESDVNRQVNFILTSLANLPMDPPKGNELRKIVEMMQLKNLEKRESRLERAFELGSAELMGNFRIAEGMSAAFSRVIPADMKRLANQMFSSDRYSIRIAYPLKYQKAEDTPVMLKTLDNGAKVIVRSFAGSEIVGLTLAFGVDSCAPDIETQRLTRLIAEMVCSFINDGENRRLSNKLDEIGARLEATFNNESLVLSARTQMQNLPELLKFLKDMIQNPDFSERFFLRGKERLIEKIEDSKSNPLTRLNSELSRGLFPGLNYFTPDLKKEDVELITYENVSQFYRSWAAASNLCISAVGNFSTPRTLALIAETFRDMPEGKAVELSACPDWVSTPLRETQIKEISIPSSDGNAHIAVAFRMKQFLQLGSHEELRTNFGANSVMAHMLFNSSNALIAQELKKIDAYVSLRGGYLTNRQFSLFSIYATVPVEKVEAAQAAIQKIIAQIPELKISQEDIVASGKKLKSFFNRVLEKSDAQATLLAGFLQNGLKEDFLEEILNIYNTVSVEDVKKGAKDHFNHYLMLIARPE